MTAISGCSRSPNLIVTHFDHAEKRVIDGELAVLIIAAAHEHTPYGEPYSQANAKIQPMQLSLVSDRPVPQIIDGKTEGATRLSIALSEKPRIIILPPRTYTVTHLLRPPPIRRGYIVHSVSKSEKVLSPDDFKLKLASGEVIYSGRIISSYQSIRGLNLRVEEHLGEAIDALRSRFEDHADELQGRLKTRLIKVPKKIW